MQTPMNELIEMMNDAKEKGFENLDWPSLIRTYSLVEKEKNAIQYAYNAGRHDALDKIENTSEQYFNEKFNQ